MTLAVVTSRALDGIEAPPVQVEVHLANGLPSFTLVGLADTEVKEARERVRAALASGSTRVCGEPSCRMASARASAPRTGRNSPARLSSPANS